jgi:hypothetical protein
MHSKQCIPARTRPFRAEMYTYPKHPHPSKSQSATIPHIDFVLLDKNGNLMSLVEGHFQPKSAIPSNHAS